MGIFWTYDTVYTQRDALGSIGLVTDEAGAVLGKMHFDPWGERLNAQDWNGAEQQADITALRDITHRGFTDHEMLDAVGMVHMNGRIYDPNLGRMLSADPINSNPANLQRFNRYSYVLNNPLKYVDPWGLDPDKPNEKEPETRCIGDDQCPGGETGQPEGEQGNGEEEPADLDGVSFGDTRISGPSSSQLLGAFMRRANMMASVPRGTGGLHVDDRSADDDDEAAQLDRVQTTAERIFVNEISENDLRNRIKSSYFDRYVGTSILISSTLVLTRLL